MNKKWVKTPYCPPYMQNEGKNGVKMNKKQPFWAYFGIIWHILQNIWSFLANILIKLHNIWKHLIKTPPDLGIYAIYVWFGVEMSENSHKMCENVCILMIIVLFCVILCQFTSKMGTFPPYLQIDGQKWTKTHHFRWFIAKSNQNITKMHIKSP